MSNNSVSGPSQGFNISSIVDLVRPSERRSHHRGGGVDGYSESAGATSRGNSSNGNSLFTALLQALTQAVSQSKGAASDTSTAASTTANTATSEIGRASCRERV